MNDQPQTTADIESLVSALTEATTVAAGRAAKAERRATVVAAGALILAAGLLLVGFVDWLQSQDNGNVLDRLEQIAEDTNATAERVEEVTSPERAAQSAVALRRTIDDLVRQVDCDGRLRVQFLIDRLVDANLLPSGGDPVELCPVDG